MVKGYVILEVGFEYNDEIYHTGNYGETYAAPNTVFMDKDKAIEEVDKLNVNKLRGEYLDYYGYGVEEFANDEDAFMEFWRREFDKDAEYEFRVPSDATDEQLKGLIKLLSFRFFTLKEIELV